MAVSVKDCGGKEEGGWYVDADSARLYLICAGSLKSEYGFGSEFDSEMKKLFTASRSIMQADILPAQASGLRLGQYCWNRSKAG